MQSQLFKALSPDPILKTREVVVNNGKVCLEETFCRIFKTTEEAVAFKDRLQSQVDAKTAVLKDPNVAEEETLIGQFEAVITAINE